MYPYVSSWSVVQKALYLATLANKLTVCARSTYLFGTEGVANPDLLRAYNELMHRVTAASSDYIRGEEGISLSIIFEMLTAFGARREQEEHIEWAVRHTNALMLHVIDDGKTNT